MSVTWQTSCSTEYNACQATNKTSLQWVDHDGNWKSASVIVHTSILIFTEVRGIGHFQPVWRTNSRIFDQNLNENKYIILILGPVQDFTYWTSALRGFSAIIGWLLRGAFLDGFISKSRNTGTHDHIWAKYARPRQRRHHTGSSSQFRYFICKIQIGNPFSNFVLMTNVWTLGAAGVAGSIDVALGT